MRSTFLIAALLAILAASGSPSWGAAPAISMDSAVTARMWISKSKPGVDDVVGVWIPERSLFDTEQFLIGECTRIDDLGFPFGKNKITFRNITLLGVDSGNQATASNQTEKLRGGIQQDLATWFLTDAARSLFAQDSAIVISGQIKVGGKVLAFDELICALGVSEMLDGSGLTSTSRREGTDGSLPVVDGLDLPRLLKSPKRP